MKIIIFSDLDASLLDENDYSFDSASGALTLLKDKDIPLVFNSSKTFSEMLLWKEKMNNTWPFVFENGTGLAVPVDQFADFSSGQIEKNHYIKINGKDYAEILGTLVHLRSQGFKFQGFHDMTAEEVAEVTSLPATMAEMSLLRKGSEPILWQGDESSFHRFKDLLEENQLQCIEGGRFYHIKSLSNKATGVKALLPCFEKQYKKIITVGIGDSKNDLPLLEVCDYGIAIPNPAKKQLQPQQKNLIRPGSPGPAGWAEGVTRVLGIIEKQNG